MPSNEKKRVVVLASGRGSNLKALLQACRDGRLAASIEAVVVNVDGAGAIEIAKSFNVPVHCVAHAGLKRPEHETKVLATLEKIKPDWLVLAGYMRLFTGEFVRRFWDERLRAARIVNIHPSLLPSFPGKDGYAQAISHGVKVTGVTVHLVGSGLDDGPIVMQRPLEVREHDTEESLSKRGLEIEHALYVDALQALFTKPWKVSEGSVAGGRPRVEFTGVSK